jgi:hypothetical protein
MPSEVILRPATEAELASLRNILQTAATTGMRLRQGAENALVLWAASLLGLMILWLGSAWLSRKLFNVADFGLHSAAGVWIFGLGAAVCAVYALISSIRWIRAWEDCRPLLKADIDTGQVHEEHYAFTSAKRFQEPEHGGLMYFLRTTEDKVLALFDYESQDLGVQEDDPFKSSFVPMSDLIMIKAPKAGFVLGTTFSGIPLEAGDPIELCVEPKHWPESESYVSIPWSELEARLGPARSSH